MAASKDKGRAILSYATPNPVGPYKLVTPLTPKTGAETTRTPVMPVMGGTLVNLPAPVMPTKQTTPVAPPMADKLVNVPKQQRQVVDKASSVEQIVKDGQRLSDALLRASTGPAGYGSSFKLSELEQGLVRTVQEAGPVIRNVYEGYLEELGSNPDTKSLTRVQRESTAAKRVSQDLMAAKIYGFADEIAHTVSYPVRHALSYMFPGDIPETKPNDGSRKADQFRLVIRTLPTDVQQTLVSLAPGWTGTFKELVDAARSLSK